MLFYNQKRKTTQKEIKIMMNIRDLEMKLAELENKAFYYEVGYDYLGYKEMRILEGIYREIREVKEKLEAYK